MAALDISTGRFTVVGGPSAGCIVEMDRGRRDIYLYDPFPSVGEVGPGAGNEVCPSAGATLYVVDSFHFHTQEHGSTRSFYFLRPRSMSLGEVMDELMRYYRCTVDTIGEQQRVRYRR